MRNFVAGVLIGLLLMATGSALAMTQWSHKGAGVFCRSQKDMVACAPTTGKGYGIGINRNFIMVMRIKDQKVVFRVMQPAAT